MIYPIVFIIGTLFGTEVAGTVTDKSTRNDSEDGRTYSIEITYNFDNKEFDENMSVNKSKYKSFNVGDRVNVKFLPALRQYTQSFKKADVGTYELPDFATIAFFVFFAVFWNAIVSVFVLALYVAPVVNWWLLRFGEVCQGLVVGKSSYVDDGTTKYKIEYAYTPGRKLEYDPSGFDNDNFVKLERNEAKAKSKASSRSGFSRRIDQSADVDQAIYRSFEKGDEICVLYSEKWSKVHCVYEFSDCELVS